MAAFKSTAKVATLFLFFIAMSYVCGIAEAAANRKLLRKSERRRKSFTGASGTASNLGGGGGLTAAATTLTTVASFFPEGRIVNRVLSATATGLTSLRDAIFGGGD